MKQFFTLTSFLVLFLHHLTMYGCRTPPGPSASTIEDVIIQNSLPKGNARLDDSGRNGYNHPSGKNFTYVVFWTRVINKAADPLTLTVNFPADSFAAPGSRSPYYKFFVLPATMSPEKESMIDYGVTDLKSFLDNHLTKSTLLQRTVNPKEASDFYIVAISDAGKNGAVRAGIVLNGHNLFYKTNMLDTLIPCGHIVFNRQGTETLQ